MWSVCVKYSERTEKTDFIKEIYHTVSIIFLINDIYLEMSTYVLSLWDLVSSLNVVLVVLTASIIFEDY